MLIKGAAVLAHTGWQGRATPDGRPRHRRPRARSPPPPQRSCARATSSRPTARRAPTSTSCTRSASTTTAAPRSTCTGTRSTPRCTTTRTRRSGPRRSPPGYRDVDCLVMCREDTLLQAVVQGREHTETHPLRWAADAAELLRERGRRRSTRGGWTQQARRHRVERELREGLDVLAELGVVPEAVRGRPAAARGRRWPGARTRRSARGRSHPPPASGSPTSWRAGCGGRSRPARRSTSATPRCT